MSALSRYAEAGSPIRDGHGAIDEDLYCLSCGYNLRGLCGDPVRCPECGASNDVGLITVPAGMIREALRDMETAPTWCVACALAFFVFAPLLFIGNPHVTIFSSIVMVCSAFGWWVASYEMRRDYDNRPGWRSILWKYHAAMALCLTGVLLPVGLWFYYATRRQIVAMQREKAVRVAYEALRRAMKRRR